MRGSSAKYPGNITDAGSCSSGQSSLKGWCGLLKLTSSYKGMNNVHEDIFCYGKVVRKYDEDDRHCVRLEIWAENPQGERTVSGSAVVALPSRN